MPTPKPFFTLEQQLDKLSDEKGLIINNKLYAERVLKEIGYFSLVSGYKDLYRNPTTRKYKDGTTFEEIVALYQFDANLRELFLKYLLLIEQKNAFFHIVLLHGTLRRGANALPVSL